MRIGCRLTLAIWSDVFLRPLSRNFRSRQGFARCALQPVPNEFKTSAGRKTRDSPGDRSAAEMAFARRSARLCFVRSHDNWAASRGRPRTGRDVFRALPHAGLSFGPERLVLSGERLVRFQACHSRNARSEHLDQLNRSRDSLRRSVKRQSSQLRGRTSSVTPRAFFAK